MDLTLIPFGYDRTNDRLVDVHSVESGKGCGVTCPSCKTPLIARKGAVNAWHFAHDTRSVVHRLQSTCRYSFYVSVRMMACQVLKGDLSIRLPRYVIGVSGREQLTGKTVSVIENVTEASSVRLNGAKAEVRVGNTVLDVVGSVGEYRVGLVFTHPGTNPSTGIAGTRKDDLGIVSVSLDAATELFSKAGTASESYAERLGTFILESTDSKKWLYHPREDAIKARATKALESKLAKTQARRPKPAGRTIRKVRSRDPELQDARDNTGQVYSYICRLCNSEWSGDSRARECKRCHSPLLVSQTRQSDH